MSTPVIKSHLTLHNVESRIEGERLLAAEVYVTVEHETGVEWVDVTGWSRLKLYMWLGY